MIAAYNETGNYNYYLYTRVYKYFSTFSILCYKKFFTFARGLLWELTRVIKEGFELRIEEIIEIRYSWIGKLINVKILQ